MLLLFAQLQQINATIWHPAAIILFFFITGFYLTIRLLFPQLRLFYPAIKAIFQKQSSEKFEDEFTPWQSLVLSTVSSAGTGSIIGVITAVKIGGPGAVLWFWIGTIVAMALKFVAVSLSIKHDRFKNKFNHHGSMLTTAKFVLTKKWRWLAWFSAIAFAICAGCGIGSIIHSNTISGLLSETLLLPKWLSGVLFVSFLIIPHFLKSKRYFKILTLIFPPAVVIYCSVSIIVIITYREQVFESLKAIILGAFSPDAPAGGITATGIVEAVRYGTSRGIYAHEGGIGFESVIFGKTFGNNQTKKGSIAMLGAIPGGLIISALTSIMILSSGITGKKIKREVGIEDVRLHGESLEPVAEMQDVMPKLTGLLRISEGTMEGKSTLSFENSLIESPKFILDNKPFNGSLSFIDGKIADGTVFTRGEGQGVLGRELPHHQILSRSKIKEIKVTGYLKPHPAHAVLLAAEPSLGKTGRIIIIIIFIVLCISAPAVWSITGTEFIAYVLGAKFKIPYIIINALCFFAGALMPQNLTWCISDILNAIVLLPNLVMMWLLAGISSELLNNKIQPSSLLQEEKQAWKGKKRKK